MKEDILKRFFLHISSAYTLISGFFLKQARKTLRMFFGLCAMRFLPFPVRHVDRILVVPPDLGFSDPKIAYQIYAGRYVFAGHVVDTGGDSPFQAKVRDARWNSALHDFGWLSHLHAAGTDLAAANARALISDWIAFHGRSPLGNAWDSLITAKRIISWLQCSAFVLRGAEPDFHPFFLKCLFLHVRYLRMVVVISSSGVERLFIRMALAFSALSLASSAALLRLELRNLAEELDRQILPDGGHISRNPAVLIDLLPDLLSFKKASLSQGELSSPVFPGLLERMFAALRFFQHSDGSMARFNGMGATIHEQVARLLCHDESDAPPLLRILHSGYERLCMGQTVIIADTGVPPPHDFSSTAHAGCLAFELSSAGQGFIINCGVDSLGDAETDLLARCTAAHSTAILNDTSQAHFSYPGWLSCFTKAPLSGGATRVLCRRLDEPGVQGFLARHDSYVERTGMYHERGIRLSESGNLVLGADRFFPRLNARIPAEGHDRIVLRFHIHPDVELQTLCEGQFSLITRSGENWTFISYDAIASVEESIFFASPNGPRRTNQIVLSAYASCVSEIRWQMRRDSV